MIIEWHTHVYPPEEAADNPTWDGKSGPTWAGRCPMTVENVLDAHRKAGIAVSVVSNAAHYLRGLAYQEKADYGQARANFQSALKLVPEYELARRALARLQRR